MKRIKQILALAVAVITALALSTAALANETEEPAATYPGSITINNAVNGQTYTIYRMIDLDSHNSGYTAINYKVNSDWQTFFGTGGGAEYVNIDTMGYVTWVEGKEAADLAKVAYTYSASVEAVDSAVAANGKVEFTNLPLGYYLVKSSLGAIASLDTTTASAVISEKNSKPTIDKQVKENTSGIWGKTNDANVGDKVEFKITFKVIDGDPTNYVVTDQMSTGLAFDATSLKVTIAGTDVTEGYTLQTTDLQNFTVTFQDSALAPNDEVVITYSATLTADAVIADAGNSNQATLAYKDYYRVQQTTQPSETHTYTWPVDVFKYTGANQTPLSNAQFVLSRVNGGATEYAKAVVVTSGDDADTVYRITGWAATEAEGTTFVSPANGKFLVNGLDAGAYKLTETNPPAGYNKLKNPVEFTIAGSVAADNTHAGTATVTYNNNSTGTINVENKTGSELPETGGMGTTVLYVLGGALVAGAAVALVTRRRMAGAER